MSTDRLPEDVHIRYLAWSHLDDAVWAADQGGSVWSVSLHGARRVARQHSFPAGLATDEARSRWAIVLVSGEWLVGTEEGTTATGSVRTGPACGVALVRDWLWCLSQDGFYQVVELASALVVEQGFVPPGTVCAATADRISFRRATLAGLRVVERTAEPGAADDGWEAGLRCPEHLRSSLLLSVAGAHTLGLSGNAVTVWADAVDGARAVVSRLRNKAACATIGSSGQLTWVGSQSGSVAHLDSGSNAWVSRSLDLTVASLVAIAAQPFGRLVAATNGSRLRFLHADGSLDHPLA